MHTLLEPISPQTRRRIAATLAPEDLPPDAGPGDGHLSRRCAGELADDRYQEFDRDESVVEEPTPDPPHEEAAEGGSPANGDEAVEEPPAD